MTSLEKILEFENEDVISRFTDLFAMPDAEAIEIFTETLKFLYLSQTPGVFIPDDLLILDEMWHNMILFTPEYQKFSEKHFGKYLHHVPARKKEKAEWKLAIETDPEKTRREYFKKLQFLMSVTYDQLGEATVKKWFQEYPIKYSKERLRALRK